MAPHAEIDLQSPEDGSPTSVLSKSLKQGRANGATRTSYQPCTMLRVSGTSIVNTRGDNIVLKGAGLGGHLNMENFITGYAGHEHEHRAAMAQVLGQGKAKFFFDKFLEYFFTDEDAQFFACLGLNCIRVPFNYRHFIDDQNPGTYKPEGFLWLDRIVEICSRNNLYVILDLHAVPGGQNQDWHSDTGYARALFWEFKIFQDQVIDLWVEIAKHYKGNPYIAGYNPLNEPADPEHTRLVAWYKRASDAIRAVDPDHILFIDGNTYAMDFSAFGSEVLPNAVYACHDYAMLGFPIPGQALYTGTLEQKAKLRSSFDRKVQFMRDRGTPIWNGEFGPVYADPRVDANAENINASRCALLKEQLSIYAENNTSWSIWLYKDIGYQGMIYVSPDSPYMQLVSPFVQKKQALGLDFWGVVDKSVVDSQVYKPFIDGLKKMVPEQFRDRKYPKTWTFDRQVERVVRECLLSEYLGWEFAELFRGKNEQELDELAQSFLMRNCLKREVLNDILTKDAEARVVGHP